MTNFIAIKIHYDHRTELAPHLKYSTLPSPEEYRAYLELYRENDVGGNGFHECLNYRVHRDGPVQMYLPTTCRPSVNRQDEEFVIFSFTYKGDPELPSHIVGVHGGARVLSDAQSRSGADQLVGIDERLFYQAEAPGDLVTLFTPPVEYDREDGIYTPVYGLWGNGLRNLEPLHAHNIMTAALAGAMTRMPVAGIAEQEILSREIAVLNALVQRYFPAAPRPVRKSTEPRANGWTGGLPDQEIGYLGEKHVYRRERALAKSIGAEPSAVEWISQVSPQSPFDIKTVRIVDGKLVDHFIEVKSSRASDDSNIYISSRQMDFFENNEAQSEFAFVAFTADGSVKGVRELSLSQLHHEFDISPIKFKLQKKQ